MLKFALVGATIMATVATSSSLAGVLEFESWEEFLDPNEIDQSNQRIEQMLKMEFDTKAEIRFANRPFEKPVRKSATGTKDIVDARGRMLRSSALVMS